MFYIHLFEVVAISEFMKQSNCFLLQGFMKQSNCFLLQGYEDVHVSQDN